MPSSYVSNYVHVVFSTKGRARLIPADVESELWAYIAGIAENHGVQPVSIGGMADHIHALINLGPILNIAKAAQVLQANSSRWMKEHGSKGFEWQEGYFACSVSQSQVPVVARYVQNQKEHHRKIDSADEFALLLKRHGLVVRE
jgi:putative transposase